MWVIGQPGAWHQRANQEHDGHWVQNNDEWGRDGPFLRRQVLYVWAELRIEESGRVR